MRAVVVEAGQAVIRDVPPPTPTEGEVLVRVHLAGICGTDLEIVRGYAGFQGVLGHEFAGTVTAGSARLAGKRVVADINCVCGRCDMCHSGLSNHCRRRTVVGIHGRPGAFAEFVAVPERNCLEVPDSVSDEEAVFTEPLAAAIQVVKQVKIEPRMSVAVLGTGRLGLLVAQVLALQVGSAGASPSRCRLLAVGRNPKTLGFLDRKRIRTATPGDLRQFGDQDVVVECTGSPEGLPLALRMVRPRGTIVLKTTLARAAALMPRSPDRAAGTLAMPAPKQECHPAGALDLAPAVVNEITIIGSRCGPLGEALSVLAQKQIDVTGMVTRQLPLSEGPRALELAADPGHIKVLLKIA